VWLNYTLSHSKVGYNEAAGSVMYTDVTWKVRLTDHLRVSSFLSECLRRLGLRLSDSNGSQSVKLLERYTEDVGKNHVEGLVRFYLRVDRSYRISLVHGIGMKASIDELEIITLIKGEKTGNGTEALKNGSGFFWRIEKKRASIFLKILEFLICSKLIK